MNQDISILLEDSTSVETPPMGGCVGGWVDGWVETTHYPKYLDQFLTILLETFTTGLIFVRQLKQGVKIAP